MIVEQIWTGNSLRNFNYLLACPDTGEALAIDPLDYEKCLSKAKKKGWDITQILNTHEHGDHTGGNQAMISATKAKLLAHEKSNIPGMDIGLKSGDVVRIGKTVELLSLIRLGTPCLMFVFYQKQINRAYFQVIHYSMQGLVIVITVVIQKNFTLLSQNNLQSFQTTRWFIPAMII